MFEKITRTHNRRCNDIGYRLTINLVAWVSMVTVGILVDTYLLS